MSLITEQDLKSAIAECQGQRNPNANTCIKLAAYLTIQKELYGSQEVVEIPQYSYAPAISYQSDSEFSRLIEGKNIDDVMPVLDELLEAVQVVNPRLYEGFLRKLREI
jgi:hypothetical protein